MIEWPPHLDPPDPETVAGLADHLCGDDCRGGSIATSIIAVFAYEIFGADKEGGMSLNAIAKQSGRTRAALSSSYQKTRKKPYVRVLSQIVMSQCVMASEAMKYDKFPTPEKSYRMAARDALSGNLGGAA